MPMPERIHQPQEATPDTLADVIEQVWVTDEAALVPDGNRQKLTLYTGDSPRESITIHPTWGSTDIYDGNVMISRRQGRRTEGYILTRNAETGTNHFVGTYPSRTGARQIFPSTPDTLAGLQADIMSSTPERPQSSMARLIRALGSRAQG